jgi:hypothetical protein
MQCNMEIPLASIAEIQVGLTLRGADAAKPSPDGNFHLLRISDLPVVGQMDIKIPHLIKFERDAVSRFCLNPGDLVVANRGSRATAGVFRWHVPTVAGGQFFIVRPRRDKALPEYLDWFLNRSEVQQRLLAEARGSYVQAVPISALKSLRVPLPDLDRQRSIAAVHVFSQWERTLERELAKERAHQLEQRLLAAARAKR